MLIPRDEILRQSARLDEVRGEIIAELMKIPGVIAVSDGVKRVKGSLVPEICIKVTVEKKRDLKDIPESERIPPEIKGFKTDVEERATPEIYVDPDENHYRPLVGGSCIGMSKSSGHGTMGCLATVNGGANAGKIVLLSNFHVLCPTSGTIADNARVGQPSHNGCCTCCECNEIGQVIDGEVLNANVDCAIARVYVGGTDPKNIPYLDNTIMDIGCIAGAGPIVSAGTHYSVLPGETVYKRGRTTLLTIGTVSNRGAVTGQIKYNDSPLITYSKSDQMEITPTAPIVDFSLPGDSGSVIVNAKNEVVGLLFAGDKVNHLSFANHIDYVTTRLSITINSTLIENGLPVATGTIPFEAETQSWIEEAEVQLKRTETGKKIAALIMNYRKEMQHLIRTNREVQVAWNRYCGPAYLNHIAKSIREDHLIPGEIKGVTLENLMLKMAAVLLRHGSPSLIAEIEKNYLNLLEVVSAGRRFRDWLERLEKLDRQNSIQLSYTE